MSVEPGTTCPACERRVPHPKKPSSPKTRTFSVRVPVGEHEAFTQLIDAAAGYLGAAGRPHDRFWTLQFALVNLLQQVDLEGALSRIEGGK